jgi:undecaprenyl-diphosphatase
MIKDYIKEFFEIITSLGSLYFHFFLLLLVLSLNEKVLFLKLLFSIIICFSSVAIIRILYPKDRPIKENSSTFLNSILASSFPSFHAMASIIIAFLFSQFFKNPPTTILLFITALTIAYSRIYIKKHHLIDVIFGIIFGIIISLFFLFFTS